MEFFRNWIMGVCGCTIFLSLITALIPNTSTAKIVRVCGTILLIFSVFMPLQTIRTTDYRLQLSDYAMIDTDKLSSKNEEFEISIIENRLREYILQRANQLGIDCEVSVSVERSENGSLLPQEIEICASEQSKQLENVIETECGIKPRYLIRK